jgi:phospholipid/cholesterol/gamma-HCH transport system substrate-binding protein
MADQFKNLMIGLFVTAAAGVVIFILMFLHPTVGDEGRMLRVRFTDVDKISIGTRVTYAGKPVGEVVAIEEIEEGRTGKTNAAGRVYTYELTLLVDSKVRVYNTDDVSTRTSGLLGEKNVEITPIAPKEGEKLIEIDKNIIYAETSGTVEETFKEFKDVASKLDVALDAATDILNKIRENKIIENFAATVENVESITASLNQPQELSEIVTNVHKFTNNINTTWKQVDAFIVKLKHSWVGVDKFIKDIDDAALSITKFVNHGQGIFEGITRGEGSLGRFLNSEDFYLRTNSLLSKVETVVDDINHYGLLFHTDKGWQRLRARRLNLMQQLCSPQEFRNYFNDEINQITTSLSRVYMVMNEIENKSCCTDIMDDKEFTKVFAELMRRVTMLEEEVRMYNTQVVEQQIHKTELGTAPCFPCKSQNEDNCATPCNYYDESYFQGCYPIY